MGEGQVDRRRLIFFSGKGNGYIKGVIKRLVGNRTQVIKVK
jgi:hypothetical protein